MTTDPDELVANAHQGKPGALDALLVALSDNLQSELKLRRLRDMSPSRSAADFVQDTLIRVHDHFARFPGNTFAELKRWSWRILYRRHLETRRNRQTRSSESMAWRIWAAVADRKDLPGQSFSLPPSTLERREEASRAVQLFHSGLKPHERNVIQLRLLDELPYEMIAAKVNRSSEAVRKTYGRALDRLRVLFETNGNP